MFGHFTTLCMKGLILEANFGDDPSEVFIRVNRRCTFDIKGWMMLKSFINYFSVDYRTVYNSSNIQKYIQRQYQISK